MEEEEESCRVCRGEATEEEPLFHPCKCSGSIRYVHQECLMDWLSHSKKQYCELCNHNYQFTAIYRNDMPSTLPATIFIDHLRDKLHTITKWTLRTLLVAFVWLGLVPFITVWMWRFYFWTANTMFYYINTWIVHSPKLEFYINKDTPTPSTSIIKGILYDCVEGWVIASVFTLTVIAGFLLREYIQQNVPSELNDEEEEEEEEIDAVDAAVQTNDSSEAMWVSDTDLSRPNSDTEEEQHVEVHHQQPQLDPIPEPEPEPEARGPEDINGILEAIGITGSLYILFQNSALMSLLMFLCLGGGVWIPYILGASFIALQPWRWIVRDLYHAEWFHDVPSGHCVVDRTLCITTGYMLLVIGGSMYLSRPIGRTARHIIRQLGLFLKVSLFIWIEVVFFPIGCGLLLDFVSLRMFYEHHAIPRRMLFLKENVLSSIFIHWIVGTTCIFVLTSMVTFCRDNVRPGVFWFMRDPNNDPPVNPFKELVERSVTCQLQKTAASSLLYGFVIEFGIGGLILIIGSLFQDIFPLKWSYRQPLITLPIDLLIVMFVIPYLIEYIHPKQVLRNLMVRWIQWLCHQLRLTCFLLGKRPKEEEEGVQNNGKYVKIPPEQTRSGFQLVRLFTFLPKNTQAVEDDVDDPSVIYIPPYFQLRMMLFGLFMWIFWSGLLCYLFVGPISIGRQILSRYSDQKIHDVYSYFIGLGVLLSICIVIKQIKNNQVKHILNWILNLIMIILCFGIIIPVLFGFLLQFYVIIPYQASPVVHLFQLWINGIICFYLFQTLLPNQNQFKISIQRFQSNGIQGFKMKKELKELIGPIILITMTANFLPFFIVKGLVDTRNQMYTLQWLYPSLIGVSLLYYLVKLVTAVCKKWTQSIRDDYYLVGRILHNN